MQYIVIVYAIFVSIAVVHASKTRPKRNWSILIKSKQDWGAESQGKVTFDIYEEHRKTNSIKLDEKFKENSKGLKYYNFTSEYKGILTAFKLRMDEKDCAKGKSVDFAMVEAIETYMDRTRPHFLGGRRPITIGTKKCLKFSEATLDNEPRQDFRIPPYETPGKPPFTPML